ncbi:MAG: alcohol dehydrogenase, partial [Micrococcales bacterium]|nr:alcohol dehydrogenase [Micrococcales bacterium]
MKALQFMAENKMAVNEIEKPEIGPDEVLLAARSVGICHSDIEL